MKIQLQFLILLSCCVSSFSYAAPPPPEHAKLRLTATASVKAEPNLAEVDFIVETQNQSAEQAARENARSTEKVLTAIKMAKPAPQEIQTLNYSIQATYEYDKAKRQSVLTGYRVKNQLHLQINALDSLGQLIDIAIKQGVSRIESLRFSRDNLTVLKEQALKQAIKNGLKKAQLMASAAGVKLGRLTELTPMNSTPPIRMNQFKTMSAAAESATAIEAGTLDVVAQVSMVFNLD